VVIWNKKQITMPWKETKTMEKFELKESATTPRILINFKKGKIKSITSSILSVFNFVFD
jgi:hypothetical protein